jgi:hypothetical protein
MQKCSGGSFPTSAKSFLLSSSLVNPKIEISPVLFYCHYKSRVVVEVLVAAAEVCVTY